MSVMTSPGPDRIVVKSNQDAIIQTQVPELNQARPPMEFGPTCFVKNTTIQYTHKVEKQDFEPEKLSERVSNQSGMLLHLPKRSHKSYHWMGFVPNFKNTLTTAGRSWIFKGMVPYFDASGTAMFTVNPSPVPNFLNNLAALRFKKELAMPYAHQLTTAPDLSIDFSEVRAIGTILTIKSKYTTNAVDNLMGSAYGSVIQDTRDVAQTEGGTTGTAFSLTAIQQAARTRKEALKETSIRTGVVMVMGNDIRNGFTLPDENRRIHAEGVFDSFMMGAWQSTPLQLTQVWGPPQGLVNNTFVTALVGSTLASDANVPANAGQLANCWITPWGVEPEWTNNAPDAPFPSQFPSSNPMKAYNTSTRYIKPIDEEGVVDCDVMFDWFVLNPLQPAADFTGYSVVIGVAFTSYFAKISDSVTGKLQYTTITDREEKTWIGGALQDPLTIQSVIFESGYPGQGVNDALIDGPPYQNRSAVHIGPGFLKAKHRPSEQYAGFDGHGKYAGTSINIYAFMGSHGDATMPANPADLKKLEINITQPRVSVRVPKMHQQGCLGPAHIMLYKDVSVSQDITVVGMSNVECVATAGLAPYVGGSIENAHIAASGVFFSFLHAVYIAPQSPFKCIWNADEYTLAVADYFRVFDEQRLVDLAAADRNINTASGAFGDIGAALGGSIGGPLGGALGRVGGNMLGSMFGASGEMAGRRSRDDDHSTYPRMIGYQNN